MNTTKCSYCGYPNHPDDFSCVQCRHRVTPDSSGKHTPVKPINGHTIASIPVTPALRVGRTCMRVMKREIDERTRKEKIVKVHEGIVVQDNGCFVRIYNPAPRDKGGDLSPETAELFPLTSSRVWCEKITDRSVSFPIPPALRF
jgi:hypothetical protein